jgi:hypothetical protein
MLYQEATVTLKMGDQLSLSKLSPYCEGRWKLRFPVSDIWLPLRVQMKVSLSNALLRKGCHLEDPLTELKR